MLKILRRIVRITGKYKTRIRLSYIPAFLKGIMLKAPLFLSFFVISLFMQGQMDAQKCLYFGIAIVASVILAAAFEHVSNVLQSATGYMVFADLRMKLGDHLRKLPMGYFTEGNIGKISSVLGTDMVFIEENCMGVLSELASFIIAQGLMTVSMFAMNTWLGLLSLAVVAAFMIVGNLMMKTSLKHSVIKQEGSESLTEEVLDFAEGIGIIKSYNLLGEKSKKLSDEFGKSCRESIAFEVAYGPWARALYLTFGIGTALMLALSGFLFARGMIPDTYMVGMALFLYDLFAAVKSYYSQMARLTVTSASLDRIEEVFDAEEMKDEGREMFAEADGKTAAIEYDGVSFGYTGKDVLKGVSFTVKPGEMTALVGPSGSGKSTIASLLARFWDVGSGQIRVNGKDIRKVPLGRLMDQISMVFQRVYLFQDTVYNNIAIGRPDATREEVEEAARKARCYDFIMQLPDGFDTVIGEGGASLSGGEKQRISIARCILKDAPIVILDEATASVDADNERAIQEAISELCRNKTLLVIAHRLKTIRDADQILVISDGKIVEKGDHENLISRQGVYARMVTLQAS
ncbi:ABC transporter ATP-binding protein [Aristaeella lactis]|uniref:ATP-binding cassette, subfamily B n=1 Tax=Aristaeella lactis TaxID=3046383 RepID=A0AC61PKE7_9FIRM|nr:ABC transporter ATP-binding protein [Aristaeella lactis]QUA51909.1 ABC transporter ATP-binding protein [Aristaeella lactis]SMC53340.1 ATP-binding cassette, subfamily B [Aristaeella lactis]